MVDYNTFGKTFSESRLNMRWAELEYFFEKIDPNDYILDIGCGNGRLLSQYKEYFGELPKNYCGIDLSKVLISEAKKIFPEQNFLIGDMGEITKLISFSGKERDGSENQREFCNIFLIASYHHLDNLESRLRVLEQIYDILEPGGKIYMTNWLLHEGENKSTYMESKKENSKNKFGSYDYDIKIGVNMRYYHSFDLSELEYLARKNGFKICENRVFNTGRNIISIFEK